MVGAGDVGVVWRDPDCVLRLFLAVKGHYYDFVVFDPLLLGAQVPDLPLVSESCGSSGCRLGYRLCRVIGPVV